MLVLEHMEVIFFLIWKLDEEASDIAAEHVPL